MASMNDRLEQIETKIAYLEQANADLGEQVYRQRLEIEALRGRLAALLERFEAAQSVPTAYTLEDEKPPHY